MERYIAIDNVCAWPNMTLLPNGEIIATVFNQPCHGSWEGDAECWASGDGGRSWKYRGTPAPHEPETNRMNLAAGLNGAGELVVIISGWSNRPTKAAYDQGDKRIFTDSRVLMPWVCRSGDAGKTWSITKAFPEAPEPGMAALVPFGDVQTAADGSVCVSAYTGRSDRTQDYNSNYFFRSRDQGKTWDKGVVIDAGGHNETAPLHLGEGRWLAAARQIKPTQATDIFISEDDGRTWRLQGAVSLPYQHPAHLLRLSDGRILLTYGNRCGGMWGIDGRVSVDEGRTWGNPVRIIPLAKADLGYPASVQTADGKVVTAYYASRSNEHQRYHMGVGIWDVEEVFPKAK